MIYKKLSIILRIVLTKIIWQVISLAGSIFSTELTKDEEQAIEWFTKSANDGNEYAQAMLDNISKFENVLLANTILSLFVNLSRCIEDDYAQKYKSFKQTADCRLRRMIRQKKLSLGIKDEQAQNYE